MPSPRKADEPAPAKVNLTLHVTGRRGDGYHLLDSLVAFADFGDRVSVSSAARSSLTVAGAEAAAVPTGPDNAVLRAAGLIGVAADIHLEKTLPSAAGLGGGSADAAATLRALARLSGRAIPADAMSLGADVPVCLLSRAARMRGIGEDLAPVALPRLPAVLVNPRRPLSTAAVFAALRQRDNPPMPDLPAFRTVAGTIRFLADQRNDLEPAACSLEPAIGLVLTRLSRDPACLLARMSGSGATCLGLCASFDAAVGLAAALAGDHPDWWIRPTTLS